MRAELETSKHRDLINLACVALLRPKSAVPTRTTKKIVTVPVCHLGWTVFCCCSYLTEYAHSTFAHEPLVSDEAELLVSLSIFSLVPMKRLAVACEGSWLSLSLKEGGAE